MSQAVRVLTERAARSRANVRSARPWVREARPPPWGERSEPLPGVGSQGFPPGGALGLGLPPGPGLGGSPGPAPVWRRAPGSNLRLALSTCITADLFTEHLAGKDVLMQL